MRYGFRARAGVVIALCGPLLLGCGKAPTRGEIFYADALDRLVQGDSVAARDLLLRAQFELPHDTRVLFQLGRLQASLNTFEGRALAEKSLREAVDRAPRNGRYREALGRVLQTQGFHHECLTQLRAAVERDPSLGDAWFALGTELLRVWRDDPGNAALRDSTQRCFDNALVALPGNDDARWLAIALRLAGGKVDAARAECSVLTGRPGCPPRFLLLEAAAEYRRQRSEAAERLLHRALAQLPPEEREPWAGIRQLIPPDSIPAYDQLAPASRDSLVAEWWWARDPTPTTSCNERMLEHVMRVQEADLLFEPIRRHRLGRDTDRGEVWVRWGTPVRQDYDGTPGAHSWRWQYSDAAEPEYFLFVDEYLNGDYKLRSGPGGYFGARGVFNYKSEATRRRFGEPPPWRFAAARFRGPQGRITVEFRYEVRDSSLSRIQADATAWRGIRDIAGACMVAPARAGLQRWGNRTVGSLRLDALPPAREVALQLQAPAVTGRAAWRAAGRLALEIEAPVPDLLQASDLLPVHRWRDPLAEPTGRDAVAVARVDSTITDGFVHLYYEIYPARRALRTHRVLTVTYRVRALPKPWKFKGQFRTEAPVLLPSVESTFELVARSPVLPQAVSLDVGVLEPGRYRFELEVADTLTQVRVERRWDFAIAPPPSSDR